MARSALVLACVVGALIAISDGKALAQSPPPWCNTSGRLNPAERTICYTRSLWNLDDTLNLSYRSPARGFQTRNGDSWKPAR